MSWGLLAGAILSSCSFLLLVLSGISEEDKLFPVIRALVLGF